MANVKIYIDNTEYEVPAGTNLIDAAKVLGNDIPVFCYHPKLKPVGMCRMCLVEMGSIEKDRATGEVLMDDGGNAKIRWFPKLQTACTSTVSEGLVIRTTTPAVIDARRNMIEFLLTSHPLDCPVCDKGGECPLQNLTLEHGNGVSRMNFGDKLQLDKHIPLGDLIYLDEERCIQCARCVRFQDEIVGDAVLGFRERARSLQIMTNSDPGFDSYFSGNTTDICPVGALTTEDFRFGARPWELTNVPTICPHCPVGCNMTASTRLDREFGGRTMIKRIMPRQNEEVNEIWICDKGRFGHHFTRSEDRLMEPMIRNSSRQLVPVSWAEAMRVTAEYLRGVEGDLAVIAGSSASNEDLWMLRQLASNLGSNRLGAWPPTHAGADEVAQVGVGKGTNLGRLGKGDAVLVIATDLEEEAPVWRLRIKQARDRGTYVVVANARKTRMADFASETLIYSLADAANAFSQIEAGEIGQKLADATNLVIVAGAEGLTLNGSQTLMTAAARFLTRTGHVGKPQNGLMAVLPGSNGMGLHYMGFTPANTQAIMQQPPRVLIVAQADIFADDPNASEWISKAQIVISLSLFPDQGAQGASVALPIQSFAERDGSFTNGERRVQRFYTAQGPMGEALPAWQIITRLSDVLGFGKPKMSAAAVMLEATQNIPAFAGTRYTELSKVTPQFPEVGGTDMYYGGTSYKNTGGVGVQIASAADEGTALASGGEALTSGETQSPAVAEGSLLIVPTASLYDRARTFQPSEQALMGARTPMPYVEINAADAAKMDIQDGDMVRVQAGASSLMVRAHVNGMAPVGAVLLPRHLSEHAVPLVATAGTVSKA